VDNTISFSVRGDPKAKGSMRAFPVKRKDGSLGTVMTNQNPKTREWEDRVALMAVENQPDTIWDDPVSVHVSFELTRPKGHFGTGKNADKVKDSAPDWPTKKPDLDKLVRTILDAITGVIVADDSQVVKVYARRHSMNGLANRFLTRLCPTKSAHSTLRRWARATGGCVSI
jgi:Holliday junction resolvase RusA-like endonuclease